MTVLGVEFRAAVDEIVVLKIERYATEAETEAIFTVLQEYELRERGAE